MQRPDDRQLEAFAVRWGCDFDAPPDLLAPIWSPRLQPQAVMLSPIEQEDAETEPVVPLAHLDGLDRRRAADVWRVDDAPHQFWLLNAVPDAATFYAVTLPLDSFLELRAHAARCPLAIIDAATAWSTYRCAACKSPTIFKPVLIRRYAPGTN